MIDDFNNITMKDLNDFFENHLDIMFSIGTDGNFLKVNKTWRETLGYSLEDLKDIHIIDIIHPDYREDALGFVFDKKNSENNFISDVKFKTKSGDYKSIECKVHLLNNIYLVSARDLSSLASTKMLLEESQSKFQMNLDLQSLISNIAFDLISTDDYNNALSTCLKNIGEFLKLSSILIFIDSSIESYSFLKYSWFNERLKTNTYTEHAIDYNSVPSYKELLSRDGLIFSDDMSGLPFDLRTHLIINNVSSVAILPIYIDGQIKGIMRFDCYLNSYSWDKSLVESLKMLSKIISSSYDKFISNLKLEESQKSLAMFFDNSRDGFFFMMLDEPIPWNDYVDKDELIDYVFRNQKVTKANKATLEQYNSSEEEFIGTTPADFYIDNLSRGKELWRELFDNGVLHIDGVIPSHFNEKIMIQGDYVCLYDDSGRISGHFAVQRDITKERIAQTIIAQSEMRFSQLAENIEEIFWVRENGKISYVNSAFEKITGISVGEVSDEFTLTKGLILKEDLVEVFKAYDKSPNNFNMKYRIKRPNGEIRWIWERGRVFKCPISNVVRTVGVSADITNMKELEEKLERLSSIDGLTQIYNRKYVFDRLEDVSNDYVKNGTVFSFAILDIDFFKRVNDSYGHTAGDFILKEFAQTIKSNIRSSDILGRYGGEEFVIVLNGTSRDDALFVVEKILNIVRNTTFKYHNYEIAFTFSAGISDSLELNQSTFNINQLVNLADERLYLAKDTGRNKIII